MNDYDIIDLDIIFQVEFPEHGKYEFTDYIMAKLALAVKNGLDLSTELKAAVINMDNAIDCIFDIDTREADYIRSRGLDIDTTTHETMCHLDTDMKAALSAISKRTISGDEYDLLLYDLVSIKGFIRDAKQIEAMAHAITDFDIHDVHEVMP